VTDSWEGRYQRSMGVCRGSGLVAGKLSGYGTKQFGVNCWPEQTAFIVKGDAYDEFCVRPSTRLIEAEIEGLLAAGQATQADMAVALRKLELEIAERKRAEAALRESEEQFRNLVETTSDWIWAIDADSRYTYASPRVHDASRPVSLNRLVADSLDMLGRLVGEDVHIQTDLRPDSGQVMADPGQLHQVLMNLVVNARDAMPAGGCLTLATSATELDPTSAAYLEASPGWYSVLTVSDTGIGMSEEVRRRVFEPFFTTKGEGKGTGLGLATVYGIVQQSGGWADAESAPGRGATFRIGLPLLAEPVPETVLAAPPASLGGTETILVVEDQDDLREFVVEVLEGYGYRVLQAASGSAALAVAGEHSGEIQLLLTDVVMPHMTGKQLMVRMKALHPESGVLYMSGYPDEVIARHDLLESQAGFIQKPFSPDALARKLREMFELA